MTHPTGALGDRVTLRPMSKPEFAAYAADAVEDYAQHWHVSGGMPLAEARAKADQDYARLLPDGLASPDQALWSAVDSDRAEPVGMLWIGVQTQSDGRHAWVYDIRVAEASRRRGYGRAILLAGHAWCREQRLASIGLHVFGDNTGARALYESLGYVTTSVLMRHDLT